MTDVLTSIIVDLNSREEHIVWGKEGENKGRGIEVMLSENGNILSKAELDTYQIYLLAKTSKGDVYKIQQSGDMDAITFYYPSDIMVPGTTLLELHISKDDKLIISKNFRLEIEESLIGEAEIPEGNKSLFYQLLEAAENEDERIKNEKIRQKNNEIVEGWISNPNQFKGDKGDKGPKGDKGDKGDIGLPGAGLEITDKVDKLPEFAKNGDVYLVDNILWLYRDKWIELGEFRGPKGEQGQTGIGLEYKWTGDNLGIRREDEEYYSWQSLRGPKGDKGDKGPKGDKGDKGDPGTGAVNSVNDKSGDVKLYASDIKLNEAVEQSIADELDKKANKEHTHLANDITTSHSKNFVTMAEKLKIQTIDEKIDKTDIIIIKKGESEPTLKEGQILIICEEV